MKNHNVLELDVAPEMLLYKILQSQSYDEEAAISEFVDNSIQSFLENQDIVENPTINIKIDSKSKSIIIEDNAGGIRRNDLQRAITMGRDPNQPHLDDSLSVYGMGLKSSAIWFSSRWKLETSCINSNEKLSFVFDLDNLLATNLSRVLVSSEEEKTSEHYTKITLLGHTRKDDFEFYRNIVLPFLLETFFKFKDIKINVIHNDVVVLADEKKMFLSANPALNTQKFNKNNVIEDPNSPLILWEKNIDFSIENRSIYGFIRIMETGKYKQPGIKLLRNKRVVQGTSIKPNLPAAITGTKNKFGAQRFYGEINLDEFSVNYQKTGFNEDLSGVYSKIKEILTNGNNFIDQANNYRVNPKQTKKQDASNNHPDNSQDPSNNNPDNLKSNNNFKKASNNSPTQIKKSNALSKALARTNNNKLPKLYDSLCTVSLREHPILMYIGAWSFLESLSALMGKNDNTSFEGYLNGKVSNFYTNKTTKNDVKESISDIHKKGNSIKHSKDKYVINGAQLHNDFEVLENFLLYCLNDL